MSETAVQSRKMCFVELEDEAKALFEEAFAEHEISFVDRLDEVPEDTRLGVHHGENRRLLSG